MRGKLVTRGKAKKADFILYYKPNIPIALIEAKDNTHIVGHGIQQGLDYAATLEIPFVFSSNGDGFVFHDRTGRSVPIETNLELDAFPSPADLWGRYRSWKGLDAEAEQIVLQDYFDDGSGKAPRYYQMNAVNAAIEAIAKGRDRVLLVMATGTGKTYTAFQIIWRLWKAGRKKRILFLADRNVLIDQTMVNDFRPFGAAMAKLSTNAKTIERQDGTTVDLTLALDRKRRIDTAFEVYLGLYQAITGPEERQKLYREFSPGFFDLIVIDECHRGSPAEDSAWREILTHFSGATQIGLTATPKETEYVSNTDYFGEPVFTYSLKQGISDGFLAPYKVIKVHIDRDVEGYRPELGQLDRDGNEVEDRIYNAKDFDRHIVLDDRTVLTAKKITEFLKESGGRFVLGLGAGWHIPETQAYGMDLDPLGQRLRDLRAAVLAIRELIKPEAGVWPTDGADSSTTGGVSIDAPPYQLRHARNDPLPLQGERLPIWLGVQGLHVGMRLVAELADGWNFSGAFAQDELSTRVDAIKRNCEAIGRDPSEIEISAQLRVDVDDLASALASCRRFVREGVRHMILYLDGRQGVGDDAGVGAGIDLPPHGVVDRLGVARVHILDHWKDLVLDGGDGGPGQEGPGDAAALEAVVGFDLAEDEHAMFERLVDHRQEDRELMDAGRYLLNLHNKCSVVSGHEGAPPADLRNDLNFPGTFPVLLFFSVLLDVVNLK